MNTTATTTAAALAMLAVAACGAQSAGDEDDGIDPGVRLSVPDSAASSSVDVVVEQAGLDVGDEIAIYAYRTAFDETDPVCQGDAAPVGKIAVSGDGVEPVATTLPGGPGRYWWQLVAPGYTSKCGAASTVYKAVPELGLTKTDGSDLGLNGNAPDGRAGKPYEFGIATYNAPPEDDVWRVEAVWYGPFESTPEAVAAGCDEGTPIAARAMVEVRSEGDHATRVTVDTPGVYRIVAHTEETAHAAAATTSCDEYAPFVAIE